MLSGRTSYRAGARRKLLALLESRPRVVVTSAILCGQSGRRPVAMQRVESRHIPVGRVSQVYSCLQCATALPLTWRTSGPPRELRVSSCYTAGLVSGVSFSD